MDNLADSGQGNTPPRTPSTPSSAISPINPIDITPSSRHSQCVFATKKPRKLADPTSTEMGSTIATNVASKDATDIKPNTKKVVELLILDHGKTWADRPHQAFLAELSLNGYTPISSYPSTVVGDITGYNPLVILVMHAKTLHRTVDRTAVITELRDFARAGGVVIFGSVPHAIKYPDAKNAENVFTDAFDIKWTVGDELEMEIQAGKESIRPLTTVLKGTYLNGVSIEKRLYRPHTDTIEENEPCAVALKRYGNGCMGFIGAEDLFGVEARGMVLGMCQVARGMVKLEEGKTPAAVMGRLWQPPGWKG